MVAEKGIENTTSRGTTLNVLNSTQTVINEALEKLGYPEGSI